MDVDPEEKQRIREKIEKLKQSKFKQQTLPAWRPVPTAMSTMLTFSIFSVIFLAIGVVLYVLSEKIYESSTPYHEKCASNLQSGSKCSVDLPNVENEVKGPVYVYYQLDNFYQNHRRYVKSRDSAQLNGEYRKPEQLGDCDPIITVADLWDHQQHAWGKDGKRNGAKLDPKAPAIPCGLVAKSIFNDTYTLKHDGTAITIDQTNIAWSSDKLYKFENIQNPPDGKEWYDIQWYDMKDEHFIVWMRTAGLPNFRKLWGRIEGGLKPGKYSVEIDNQFEVAPFQGKKYFVLSTTNALGGKNYFLAICYIVVGTLCMLFAFIFCIAYMRKKSNNPGQN